MEFHNIPPVYDSKSEVLILGSFPSVKSREGGFFYHHPQNRFWKVVSAVLDADTPETIEQKIKLLTSSRIALWDVIASCEIKGSSDSDITGATPNDLSEILACSNVGRIFTNGSLAHRLYQKHIKPKIGIDDVALPSTSAANASYSLERLVEKWRILF